MTITTRFTPSTYKHPIPGVMFSVITRDHHYADALWISDEDTIGSIESNVHRIINELIPYDRGITHE